MSHQVPMRRTMILVTLLAACTRAPDERARDTAAPSSGTRDTAAAQLPVVTPHGLGPLVVGATFAEASGALGGALARAANSDTLACDYARWRGGPVGVTVMVDSGRVARVEVDSGTIATAEGARIGDDEARIRALYPGRVTKSPHKYTDGHYLTVRPAQASDTTHLIVFETDGQTVLRYRGGRKPQVEYVESCA